MWKCNKCGTENSKDTAVCKNCNEKKRSPKIKRIKRRNLIIGAILATFVVAAVIILIFLSADKTPNLKMTECATYQQILDNNPELTEKDVALKVGNGAVSKDEWSAYFMYKAKEYADTKGLEIDAVKWNEQGDNNESIIDSLRGETIKEIVINTVAVRNAKAWGIGLSDEEIYNIDTNINQAKQVYGENVYKVLNVKDEETYRRLSVNMFLADKVIEEAASNPEKYLAGIELANYADNKSATVKIIGFTKGEDEALSQIAKTNMEAVAKRLESGENFDDVWKETSNNPAGFAVKQNVYKDGGNIDKTIETKAVSLKIGEVCDVIETNGGYYIMMRVVGGTEVRNYFLDESEVSINNNIINESKVK